ncbi:MAG: hypothetical protein AAGJ10_11170 [Bacteroidota bacterium]
MVFQPYGILRRKRAFRTIAFGPRQLMATTLLTVALSALWYMAWPFVQASWGWLFATASPWLNLPATVGSTTHVWPVYGEIALPTLELTGRSVHGGTWTSALGITLFVAWASTKLPERFMPLTYFLRTIVLLEAVSLVYFAVTPETFPYTLSGYIGNMLHTGAALIALVPVIYGFTLFPFDIPWRHKIGLSLLTMGYLAVFIPLQYLTHAVLLYSGSLIFLPTLYMLLGIPLDVLALIALYAWGMSWPGRLDDIGDHPTTAHNHATAQPL